MTVGGFKVSEPQFVALLKLLEKERIIAGNLDGRGGGIQRRTAKALISLGLIETFVPDATSYAMAVRGRARYYRLTAAGTEATRGLKKLYKQKPTAKALPAKPARRVRQRIVDT